MSSYFQVSFTVFLPIPSSVLYFVCTIDVDAKEPTLVEGPNTRSYLILSYLILTKDCFKRLASKVTITNQYSRHSQNGNCDGVTLARLH